MKSPLRSLTALLLSSVSVNAQQFGADVGKPITPVVTSGGYSAGQAIGGLQTVSIFRSPNTRAGIHDFFMMIEKSGATIPATIYIFDTKPSTGTTCNDNTGFTLASADMSKVAFTPFIVTPAVPQNGSMAVGENVAIHSVQNQDVPLPGTQNLYFCAVANSSGTLASVSDIIFKMGMAQD